MAIHLPVWLQRGSIHIPLDPIMDISLESLITLALAAAGFLITWGAFGQRIKNLEAAQEKDRQYWRGEKSLLIEQIRPLDELANRLDVRLAVLESIVKDSREDRIRHHVETQNTLAEMRKDVTRMIAVIAHLAPTQRPNLNSGFELKDQV